jgi:hypothetical protein
MTRMYLTARQICDSDVEVNDDDDDDDWLQNRWLYVTAILVEKQAEEELLDRLVEGVTQMGARVVVILALTLY